MLGSCSVKIVTNITRDFKLIIAKFCMCITDDPLLQVPQPKCSCVLRRFYRVGQNSE
jgi:hypothetical protein